jgi:hypothetical protein
LPENKSLIRKSRTPDKTTILRDCQHARNLQINRSQRQGANTVISEISQYSDHFDFVADCMLWKDESRPQFFKILAVRAEGYPLATFV